MIRQFPMQKPGEDEHSIASSSQILKQNDPPLFALTRAYEQSNERGERHRALDQDRSSGALLNVKEYSLCVLSVSQLSSLHI